ncbi:MAG TPA: right-handed parallel beta-helix repeat-containing protein [Gaiellaceae bacterium]|nr:right-handed parallel beta-helix repeat-containing protein [Gaiellaceae bacterium]
MARASLLACCALAALVAPAPAVAACAGWAHPGGNDRAEGTPRAPVKTITELMSRLTPGQTGCLAGAQTFTEGARIVKSGSPGRPVRLLGNGSILRGGIAIRASDVVVSGLRIRGLGERRRGVVVIEGERVAVLRNDITATDIVKWTPCILLDGAAGTTIDGNTIHECTKATSRSVVAQGIYVVNSTGTTIANNVVARTSGEGIALSGARRVAVVRNHVYGNTNGVYLGPGTTQAMVVNNVIAYSGRSNVHGDGGSANLVTSNCLWKGFGGNVAGGGFAATGNLVRSPRYVNRYRSLALRPGPCKGRAPRSKRSAESVGTELPVMPDFRIHYRLLGFPSRVQVVSLSFTRLVPGARVAVRCARGCSAREAQIVEGSGRAANGSLRGRWLARGTVLEVRSTAEGWLGAFARVTVVGAPRGVRITHACLGPGRLRPVDCARYTRR